ncbi:MAG: GNAT family N-acetyltransferase [Chloroflexi bacterium]|nr:GNAT family N-acetyltransferase [Chloroflexota bacterium]
MFGPVIKGKKVTLRPPKEGDAALFIEWFADTEVTRYLATVFPLSLEGEQAALTRLGESKDDVWWVIEAEGRSIGASGIHRIDWIDSHAITGTVIGDKSAWRKGYGSESMALRTAYAFRQLNLHKLKSGAFMENEPSKRALRKAGYREVGVSREDFWRDGAWHDHWECELLRSDWERLQQAL